MWHPKRPARKILRVMEDSASASTRRAGLADLSPASATTVQHTSAPRAKKVLRRQPLLLPVACTWWWWCVGGGGGGTDSSVLPILLTAVFLGLADSHISMSQSTNLNPIPDAALLACPHPTLVGFGQNGCVYSSNVVRTQMKGSGSEHQSSARNNAVWEVRKRRRSGVR